MTRALVEKEARALLAVWLVAAAGVVSRHLPGMQPFRGFDTFAYLVGAFALGATAVGHEYRYGTFAQLLAQPAGRGRILVVKLAVLGALLLALAAVALVFPFAHETWGDSGPSAMLAFLVLPPLAALSVAPWLTLKTRSMLAGTLFTGALTSVLYIGSWFWAARRFDTIPEFIAARFTVIWTVSILASMGAAYGLWRAFATLELADGGGPEIPLPSRTRAAGDGLRKQSAVAALVGKELRLQQLTFAASGLYVAGFVIAILVEPAHATRPDIFGVMAAIHAIVVAALAGALSSAQERALGVHEWQLLQPRAVPWQFAVKIGVTFGLTLVLALGVPTLLSSIFGGGSWPRTLGRADLLNLCLFFAAGVYLSSLVSNGLTALLLSIPAFFASAMFYRALFVVFHPPTYRPEEPAGQAVQLAFVALILWFALRNHRDAGQPISRAAGQVAVAAGLYTIVFAAWSAAAR